MLVGALLVYAALAFSICGMIFDWPTSLIPFVYAWMAIGVILTVVGAFGKLRR